MIKKIDFTDIMMFLGLAFIGVGLFLYFGLGIALTVDGVLLLLLGFFGGAIKAK